MINNKSTRDQYFNRNNQVTIMKKSITLAQRYLDDYSGSLQKVIFCEGCYGQYETELGQYKTKQKEVEAKEKELHVLQEQLSSKMQVRQMKDTELQMHTPEELLEKVKQRVSSLRNTSEMMKIQYVNQEMSASVVLETTN